MDALLNPAESHALQSFLSAMDYQDISASEWALYSANNADIAPNDDLLAPTQTSEALAKATKDLMSLDAGRWNSQPQPQLGGYNTQPPQHQQQYPNAYSHRQAPYSRRETFPFLTSKTQMQQPMLLIQDDPHNHIISPTTTSAPTSTITTPATPQSPFGFPDLQSSSSMHLQHTQLLLNHPPSRSRRPSSPGTKRSSPSSASGASLQSNKRLRPSPPDSSTASAKQTLLSPSQKKANHIQSEQKRRANIRRGYEALCETVPALRESIREEEEVEAKMNMGHGPSGKPSRSKRKKRDDNDRDKEKQADGRAGPRSENVVLSKTIDYITELLNERSSLLTRLRRAKSSLPLGHPALVPTCIGEPLWEREWKGGDGRLDGEDGDEDDENGDDGHDSA